MNLKFLGRGAAINPTEGSTAAYFISDDELFLIDCGESIYSALVSLNLLDKYKVLNIFLTHLHCDHVGSLGSLLVYAYYVAKVKVNLVVLENDYLPNLKELLRIFNTPEELYNFISAEDLDNKYTAFSKIRYSKTIHSKGLDCYSILFNTNNGIIFYSGDSSETRIIEDIIASKEKIDKLYIDVTSNPNGVVHIYIGDLAKVIPIDIKDRVYCMHYDNKKIIDMIKSEGFNLVQNEKVK